VGSWDTETLCVACARSSPRQLSGRLPRLHKLAAGHSKPAAHVQSAAVGGLGMELPGTGRYGPVAIWFCRRQKAVQPSFRKSIRAVVDIA